MEMQTPQFKYNCTPRSFAHYFGSFPPFAPPPRLVVAAHLGKEEKKIVFGRFLGGSPKGPTHKKKFSGDGGATDAQLLRSVHEYEGFWYIYMLDGV